MPFNSIAQQKFMYAQKPKLAAEMQSKTPANINLPEKVKPAPAPTPERKKMAMQNMVAKYGKQV